MTRFLTVIVASALLAVNVQASEPSPARKEPDAEPGRFQLFQGSYSTFDLRRSETYTTTSVFLIDTRTGEVKRYVNKIDSDGRYIEEWVPTSRVQERR